MCRIGRPAIGAEGRPRANGRVIPTVEGVVAGLAEAAERREFERDVITPMRFDVISDRRSRHVAAFQTNPTQRLHT